MSFKRIVPVILCGGVGSRLWPISRKMHPKQFLKINDEHSLFQRALLTVSNDTLFSNPIIVCSEHYKFKIASEIEEVGIENAIIITEPVQRNTCAAISIAAHYLNETIGTEYKMLVLPADHIITNRNDFIEYITTASQTEECPLVTFGIKPNYPATGYGYIRLGDKKNNSIYKVSSFIEKPNLEKANTLILDGTYYWNSGIFLLDVESYLSELKELKSDIFKHTKNAVKNRKQLLNFVQIDNEHFSKCKDISIDCAIFEHTNKASIMPVDIKWHDLGSWKAMYDYQAKDENQNVVIGANIDTSSSNNCMVFSDTDTHVVLHKVDNVFVIVSKDAVLIINRNNAEEVKAIYNNFENHNNKIAEHNNTHHRPWGSYEDILVIPGARIKKIIVNPHQQLSLQYHNKRSEHWIVLKGEAEVVKGDRIFTLKEDESIHIPIQVLHRIKNKTNEPLELIEVQLGTYLGEDDIVRVEDIYERHKVDSTTLAHTCS